MNTTTDFIASASESILKTYNRQPINFDYGKGVYLFDTHGKKYLDFGSGVGVNALGYGNKAFNDALKAQIDKVLHISNLYYNTPAIEAAQKLRRACGLDKVFFTNSGTESIEGALKVAKKYAFQKGLKNPQIIAMNNSFHGRTLGALSVTGNTSYQKPFLPLIPGVVFADFNNFESVEKFINDNTCAIILESVQGESGVTPATKEFLSQIRRICDEKDIVLILDEIQCGMGRSGKMFAYQHYGIKPDVLTSAKALGCGVPVGAFVVSEKIAKHSLQPGDHGSTYGGNPFVCAAVSKVFDLFEELSLIQNVQNMTTILESKINALCKKYNFLIDHRGLGLLRGIELEERIHSKDIIVRAQEKGLIILPAGHNTLRIAPPLVIDSSHIDEMIEILDSILREI